MSQMLAIKGFIVSSKSFEDLEIINGFVLVEDGKIINIGPAESFDVLKNDGSLDKFTIIELNCTSILIPGFIDCHTHAPQFPNIGLGMDRPLLEWLDKYTFPLESKYCDKDFAAKVYDCVVKRLLINGTTTACYFGTIHLEGTLELVNAVYRHGQRAFVGKVSMNEENAHGYYNETNKELEDVKTFVERVYDLKNDLIEPAITPRFAISCDSELMTELGTLAQQYNCLIQSHISENLGEIDFVKNKFPDSKNYMDVYDRCNLINSKCIMAHAVHLGEDEIRVLSSKGVSIAHCPSSNTRLQSGMCPLVALIDKGIDVGLGTDVSGGDSASIQQAMRNAMDVSIHLKLIGQSNKVITWKEAFYLATVGGAKALNLDHKVGTFEVGKEFDALIIDVYTPDGPIDNFDQNTSQSIEETVETLLQKFIYLGDDRNIKKVFVKGNQVKTI